MRSPQEIVDTSSGPDDLIAKLEETLDQITDKEERQKFLSTVVTTTVWHGTRRLETIDELKKGFCSYTLPQMQGWIDQADEKIKEKRKVGPRVEKRLIDWSHHRMTEAEYPHRGKFSVSGYEEAVCAHKGEPPFRDPKKCFSGWGDRNPELVWEHLWMFLPPQATYDILEEMFGQPVKVKLKVKAEVRDLFGPQDMHLEQRCFTADEIQDIQPCPSCGKLVA